MKISFSELKLWKECPYKHKLVYIDGLSGFEGNEFTAFGTAIHSACEYGLKNSKENIYEFFLDCFESEVSNLPETLQIDEQLIKKMRKQAINICKHALPVLKEVFGDFDLVSLEEQLMEPITDFDSYDKKFKGFIDLVIKKGDTYHIIDWKTCSWGWDSRRRSDPMTNYQLSYYKHFFSKKHNIDPQKIKTHFILLKRTATSNVAEVVTVTTGNKRRQNSLTLLENALININKKNYIKNRLSCRGCEFYKTKDCK